MSFAAPTQRVALCLCSVALAVAACRGGEPGRPPGPPTVMPGEQAPIGTEAAVITGVQSMYYADDSLRGRDIVVTARDGVVTLRGHVPDEPTKRRAVDLARVAKGVARVEDQLHVREDDTTAESDLGGHEMAPSWITTKIRAQYFANPNVAAADIDVTAAADGAVTLEGTVASEHDKAAARRIARETDGVTRVEDRLRIASADDAPDSAVKAIDDAWITAKIQAKYFIDEDVKGRRIGVDTRNGVVTLTGRVASATEHRQAVALARTTDGVLQVNDRIRVDSSLRSGDKVAGGGRARPADERITTKLQAQYFLDAGIEGHQINVGTRDGVVTLEGFVDTAAERTEAERIARETRGVRRVINQLTIGAR